MLKHIEAEHNIERSCDGSIFDVGVEIFRLNTQEARYLTCLADAVAFKLQADGAPRAAKQGLYAEPAQTRANVEDALARNGTRKRNVLGLAAVVALRRKAERQLDPLTR